MPRPEVVSLTGTVNLGTVTRLLADALAEARSHRVGELHVDLNALEVEGSAVITLLLSLKRELTGYDLQFTGASPDLLSIARSSGVADILKLEAASS